MLTILGNSSSRFCDGLSRRDFMQVGAMGIGGLTLADLFRADALAGSNAPRKSFINIYLAGGPSHLDMWDLKPEAPPEIRGEFHPIKTNVSGMDFCHLMPKLATVADRLVLIRSLTGIVDEHSPCQTETGWSEQSLKIIGGQPSLGAVVSKLHGTSNGAVPTFVAFSDHTRTGFLGAQYAAFRPDGPGRANLTLQREINLDRFHSRQELLVQLDRVRRNVDGNHMMDAMDSFNQRAVGVLIGNRLADALDVSKENDKAKRRYGLNESRGRENERLLTARRLIEAGVRCVSLTYGGWDTHANNFVALREQLPQLDTSVSALVEDLTERGMIDDVAIAVWGEFGRTPRINPTAGRDHWSRASAAMLAGGGMKTGQVIGSTNRYGEAPQDRPVQLQEVFATLYHLMGINAAATTLPDQNGRPQYLVDNVLPIKELL